MQVLEFRFHNHRFDARSPLLYSCVIEDQYWFGAPQTLCRTLCTNGCAGLSNVILSVDTTDSLLLEWQKPTTQKNSRGSNGSPVTKYQIQWAARVNEVQQVSIKTARALSTGGYKLRFDNSDGTTQTTANCIAWNASSSYIENELNLLSIIDGVTVLRSGDGTAQTSFGYTYTITFIGPVLSNGNQNELTIEKTGCESWSSSGSHVTIVETLVEGVVGAVQEVAEVVTTGSSSMTGGFYLSTDFEGDMNVIGLHNVSVQQESRIVTTSVDLTSILYPGDYVKVESEIFRVHATATHSPNQIILDREYPLGDSAVATLYLMDTVACHSTAINANAVTVTALHCDAHFEAGDYFAINGKQYTVHSVVILPLYQPQQLPTKVKVYYLQAGVLM